MLVRLAPLFAFFAVLVVAAPASALPVFAHRYGFTCQTCHAVVPHLNEFGERFEENGFRLAGVDAKRVNPPVAVKVQLAYGSSPDASGLPKAVVDEVELLSGGTLGKRVSYFVEQYVVDGGRPGRTREAWASYTVTPPGSERRVSLRAGSMTLPLPVDPESFRETNTHYAIFDQTAGGNPFTFFDPKLGVEARLASERTAISLLGLQGHDPGSGLPTRGVDRMIALEHLAGSVRLSAYRYDGARPLAPLQDRFWRQGYAASLPFGDEKRFTLDALYQHGFDTSADGAGLGVRTSGGFVQGRATLTGRDYAIARYDGTNGDAGFLRTLTIGAGHRITRNSRLLIEDTISHQPATSHVLSASYLFAY